MSSFKINKYYASKNNDSGSKGVQKLLSSTSSLSQSLAFSLTSTQSPNMKGLNIDDSTVVLTPSSHNPPQAGDTLPAVWPGVSNLLRIIRTYHYSAGVGGKNWVLWAVQNNINVMVGLDLGADSGAAEIAAFSADYMAADATLKSQYDDNVVAIAVGNEKTDTAAINTGILNVKNLIAMGALPSAPVTTVLANVNDNWIANTYPPKDAVFTAAFLALAPNLDAVCFNFYGDYFSFGNLPPLTPEEALAAGLSWTSNGTETSVILNQFAATRFAMAAAGIGGLPFWCTEAGWGSVPQPGEVPTGWSSVGSLRTFYGNFLGFSLNGSNTFVAQGGGSAVEPPDRVFYFSVRDVPPQNEHFGLYTSAAALTPKF